MAQRGELFGEGPLACPFVALELDRDRRSEKPDYRHRCFAEPTPQPRAIAHQAAYCLSPTFTACPIFQDWAMRAAARPVPVPAGYEGRAGTTVPSAGSRAAAGIEAAAAVVPPAVPPVVPALDVLPVVPAVDESWPADAFPPPDQDDSPEQLAAFQAPAPVSDVPAVPSVREHADSGTGASGWWAAAEEPVIQEPGAAANSPAAAEAPVPGFLAGRGPARPRSSRPDTYVGAQVKREDLIPSWERDGRYGATVADERGGDRFGGVITAVAVVAILALGVAAVIFLPGLLAGGGPAKTATPVPSALTSSLPSSISTPIATTTPIVSLAPSASPAPTATSEATPHYYPVKSGDTLLRIARKFHVTVAAILAANPQIRDPDHVEPGQRILIPPTGASLPSASP